MKTFQNVWICSLGLLAILCVPASATVTFAGLKPSPVSPQTVGTTITWVASATDSGSGPLTFQFSVAPPNGAFALVKNFNVGTLAAGTWSSQPFVWMPTGGEGVYQIKVVIKDFAANQSTSKTVRFQVNPLVTGSTPVIAATANPIVVLFSAPACPVGSTVRVHFQRSGSSSATVTNWLNCNGSTTMTFEIGGMYPSSTYNMYAQTNTAGKITNGPTVNHTTGAIPANIPVPSFKVNVPGTDLTAPVILHNLVQLGGGTHYPDVATDLAGNILWYYFSSNAADLLTRPLPNGQFLTVQAGQAWNTISPQGQMLRQIDLAGNIVRETNTGIIQNQLLARGAADGGPCDIFPSPPPVGSACLGSFHHDAIEFTVAGKQYTAVIADIEKIFPAGTQGSTSSLPVDIIGDMIVVLDNNWQVVWYFDTFQHDSGPPQLDINRPAVLGETCINNQTGCPPVFLLGSGIAPKANDWLHANSLYYWPQSGDIVWSSRHQDWVMKVDYNNMAGTGNILWRMGPEGDFTFNNIYSDPWPWFSHQHDVGIENNGAGPMTIFDNGNTRLSAPPLGLGSNCGPSDCNSRGMALTYNESLKQVTPVISVDLGVYGSAMGSAQLLADGNYFFLPPNVLVTLSLVSGFSIEILPTAGTDTGTQILNLQGPEHYRAWQMPNLYSPPTT
jgi:arylsulfate sulfotransferase